MGLPRKRGIEFTILVLHIFFAFFVVGEGECGQISKSNLSVQYATHFKLKYLKSGRKLIVDGSGRKLLLVHEGGGAVSSNSTGSTMAIPVRRVIIRWSTIPSFLKALGVQDTVAGVVTRNEEACDEYIKTRIAGGDIEVVGGHGSIDYEKLAALNPDVFFVSRWEKTSKLDELDIPYAVITEYLEDNPLGRMEWMKFFAAFYDRENAARHIFSRSVRRIKSISARLREVKKRPRVLWGFIRPDGSIYAPRGKCYVSRMIRMAGGVSVLEDVKRMRDGSLSLEHFYALGKRADIYIVPQPLMVYGMATIKKLLFLNPLLRDFKSVRNGKVWCFTNRYTNSIADTDRVIEELASIFHPGLTAVHQLRYFFGLAAP